MACPMKVQGLGSGSHAAGDYVELELFLPTTNGRMAVILRETHIVDDVKANVLTGTDILVPEQIDVFLSQQKAILSSCQGVKIKIYVTALSNQTNQILLSNDRMMIPACSSAMVQIKPIHKLPTDRDLLFKPKCRLAEAFTSIADHTLSQIRIQNDSNKAVVIPRHTHLGRIVEYEADGCFLASPDLLAIARKSLMQPSWIKRTFRTLLADAVAYNVVTDNPGKGHVTAQGITIYGTNAPTMEQINNVTSKYPSLWKDSGNVIDIPEKERMDIPLLDNWKELYKVGQSKIYPLGQKDWEIVDKAFDKLHQQDHMEWTSQATPLTYPCFVVWRNTPSGRKGRVVINV